jgi:hypothetical protein
MSIEHSQNMVCFLQCFITFFFRKVWSWSIMTGSENFGGPVLKDLNLLGPLVHYWVATTIDCVEPIFGFLGSFCFEKHRSASWSRIEMFSELSGHSDIAISGRKTLQRFFLNLFSILRCFTQQCFIAGSPKSGQTTTVCFSMEVVFCLKVVLKS